MNSMEIKSRGNREHWFRGAFLLGALFFVAEPVQAGGMWNLEQGASHYARGGANLVNPGDASAVFTNPAGLAALKGFHFLLGANLVFDERAFARGTDMLGLNDSERTFESVANEEPASPSPNIFLAYNLASLGLDDLTFGFGVWGPPKSNRQFDEEGAQRYSSVITRDLQAHYLLSLGYQLSFGGVVRNVRLGASIGGTYTEVDSSLRLNVFELRKDLAPEREDPDYDILAEITGSEKSSPTGIVSASVEFDSNTTLSLTYQLPFDVSAQGNAALEMKGVLGSIASVDGDDITINLALPPIVRVGVRQDFAQGSLELAYAWEGWQRTEKIEIVPNGITIEQALDPQPVLLDTITIETKFRDTYSFRLGGDYEVLEDWILVRAGTYFERAAIEGRSLNVSQFDLDKVGFTAGGRISLGWGLFADVAFGYVHWFPETVTDSNVLFSDPAPPEGAVAETWPIGNGKYSNTQIFTMAALGGEFDL